MNRNRSCLLLPLLVFGASMLFSEASAQKGSSPWPAVKNDMRPWTRWWWMASAVDESNLKQQLTLYREAGFGGVEITPIYGVKGFEKRYVSFLSPRWMQLLHYTVSTAATLQLGVDMNTGTGWPFGGPQITPALAASRLLIMPVTDAAGKGPAIPEDQASLGATVEATIPANSIHDITPTQLNPLSGRLVIAGKTGQLVKRAAPGGEGRVMDHFSAKAVSTYLQRFDSAFGKKGTGVRAFFNDSYEVFNANWTPGFLAEFQQRRGYSLTQHITAFTGEDSSAEAGRVKSDYRQTLHELLLENFTRPWSAWAHSQHALSRNQAHGSPGNLLDLYGTVDVPECETFFGLSSFAIPGIRRDSSDIRDSVFHDPLMFKFASSAAHFYNKPLVSSETFVWLTEHFNTALSQCKPEVEQLFLSGINHVFYHGTTYSPDDAPWPGWNFYASANFVPANSLWPHMPALNGYITRCQSLLQGSTPDNELLVYWPVYDLWSNPKGLEMQFGMHTVDEWLYPTPFFGA